jgi:predicted acyl esterase
VEKLPTDYCLCIFDMSGSGKSEGEKVTYGMKEQEDIGKSVNMQSQL